MIIMMFNRKFGFIKLFQEIKNWKENLLLMFVCEVYDRLYGMVSFFFLLQFVVVVGNFEMVKDIMEFYFEVVLMNIEFLFLGFEVRYNLLVIVQIDLLGIVVYLGYL